MEARANSAAADAAAAAAAAAAAEAAAAAAASREAAAYENLGRNLTRLDVRDNQLARVPPG